MAILYVTADYANDIEANMNDEFSMILNESVYLSFISFKLDTT